MKLIGLFPSIRMIMFSNEALCLNFGLAGSKGGGVDQRAGLFKSQLSMGMHHTVPVTKYVSIMETEVD